MTKTLIRIAVTGGAGQIGYSLLFRLAAGELFGKETPIALHILEIPSAMPMLQGVAMELQDCAFPLLQDVRIGSDPHEVFGSVNIAFLVGARPRGAGMERSDLLQENAKIFVEQGKALSDVAASDVRVLVVGNPCNTNCLIAIHNAPNISPDRFQAMTRLDQNRAMSQLAHQVAMPVTKITHMTIWGNHSNTQVPDYFNARIDGQPVVNVIQDNLWLEHEFMLRVQRRGAEIIKTRGKSSAASAASSALDAMRDTFTRTQAENWFSTALYTKQNSYGIDPDLVFSFPCVSTGHGDIAIVPNVPWNRTLEEKIRASERELIEERDLVRHYLRY